MSPDPRADAWSDPRNWRAGMFYVAPSDPRTWVPKRPPGIGWTLNFARPASWVWMLVLVVVPIVILVVVLHAVRSAVVERTR